MWFVELRYDMSRKPRKSRKPTAGDEHQQPYKSIVQMPNGEMLTSVVVNQVEFNRAIDTLVNVGKDEPSGQVTTADLQKVKDAQHLPMLSRGYNTEQVFKMFGVTTKWMSLCVRGVAKRLGIHDQVKDAMEMPTDSNLEKFQDAVHRLGYDSASGPDNETLKEFLGQFRLPSSRPWESGCRDTVADSTDPRPGPNQVPPLSLDIRAVCERLISQFDLKVIGKDDPVEAVDVDDLKVNTGILAHIGKMYAVNIENGFWRQLGEYEQFVLGFAPLPGTRNGWMFRWRVSDRHLPTHLEADDPEINDTGFMILAWEHVDHLEEMIAATLAQYGGTVNLRRPPATSSPASPRHAVGAAPDQLQQALMGSQSDCEHPDARVGVDDDKPDGRIAVLSYVPGVYAKAGDCYGPDQGYIEAKLRSVAPAFCDKLLWSSDANGNLSPTFILADAKRIYEHLLWWSGQEPAKWFSLVAADVPGGYIVSLWPDVAKSRDRVKISVLVERGTVIPEDTKFRVITAPLRFSGPHSSNWDVAKSRLGATTGVGFLDTSKFDLQNASNTDFSAVLWIEGIPVATDESLKKFVRHREDITLVIYTVDM